MKQLIFFFYRYLIQLMGITVVIIKYIYTLLLCDFFLVDYLFSFDCTFHIALKKLPRMVIFSIIIKSVT